MVCVTYFEYGMVPKGGYLRLRKPESSRMKLFCKRPAWPWPEASKVKQPEEGCLCKAETRCIGVHEPFSLLASPSFCNCSIVQP